MGGEEAVGRPPPPRHALVTHVYADRHIALNAPEAVAVFPFDLVVNDPGGDVEIQDGLLHFLLEEPYRFGNGFYETSMKAFGKLYRFIEFDRLRLSQPLELLRQPEEDLVSLLIKS